MLLQIFFTCLLVPYMPALVMHTTQLCRPAVICWQAQLRLFIVERILWASASEQYAVMTNLTWLAVLYIGNPGVTVR